MFADAQSLDRTTDAEYRHMGLPYLTGILMLFVNVACFFVQEGAESSNRCFGVP